MPFWKGDSVGRPLELGRAVGAFVREMAGAGRRRRARPRQAAGLDEWAADNLLGYLREQREATRHVPSDRTILVERFRDELGDWRLVVHSPVRRQGRTARGRWPSPRGCASGAAWRCTPPAPTTASCCGCPTPSTTRAPRWCPPPRTCCSTRTSSSRSWSPSSAAPPLFAARFRECAARALLLPRRDPKRRTPLWQQRQRSAQLLAVAGRYEQFPITLEAMRECVQDVYDLPGLRQLMADVAARKVRVVEVATQSPSPFARSLLFGYVGMFLYELDAPLAERRAAALSLDSTLLAELLGSEAIRELLDPEVLDEVEASLQRLAPDRRARDARGRRRPAALPRRSVHGGGHRPRCAGGVARRAGGGSPGDPGPDRRRAALDRDRGRRSGPGRAGRRVAGRRAGGVHRARRPSGR